MKINVIVFIVFFVCLFSFPFPGRAQSLSPSEEARSFVDSDHNGINDLFADADGNGVNDVTGLPYPHMFHFIDEDGDGRNDAWADLDGDGVNDRLREILSRTWVDRDGDGILDATPMKIHKKDLSKYILDTDQDGKNDITGDHFSRSDLHGYRFGCVSEETGEVDSRFIDSDGDGMCDRFHPMDRGEKKQMDVFMDRDGDGIADDHGWNRIQEKHRGHSKK